MPKRLLRQTGRKNNETKMSLSSRTLLILTLSIAVVCVVALQLSDTASAQTRSTGTRPTRRQTPQAKPAPKPLSDLDRLGEPPPIPKLVTKPEPEVNPGEVISVETTEVMLPVTVRDAAGRLVSDLTRNDFRVFEDNSPQPLSDFALRQVPVDVVLMVDASSSAAANLDDFRRAAEGFASRLNTDDRISLIKFDDRVELLQDWTKSRFQLKRALNRIEPGMFTRFNDALLLAARDQFAGTRSRKAIIVLTDGIDSGRGTTSLEAALRALLETQVAVYVVSNTEIERASKRAELDSLLGGTDSAVKFNQLRIEDLREGLRVLDQAETNLDQLARATGARLYKPRNFQALDSTYAEVAEELRSQFALYYTPLNKSRDGSFRRVRVETIKPGYNSHTRIGYFAPRG
jgi:Ca-activated chloride channel homolog